MHLATGSAESLDLALQLLPPSAVLLDEETVQGGGRLALGLQVLANHQDRRAGLASCVHAWPGKPVDEDEVSGPAVAVLEDRHPTREVPGEERVLRPRVI